MTTHKTLPKLIKDKIESIDSVELAKIEDRISYQVIPQENIYPHVFITRQGQSSEQTLDGYDGDNTERFVIEIVSEAYDDDLVTAIGDVLDFRGGEAADGTTVFTSELEDVSDDYVFQSGDGDALFMHGFVLTLYL
jgi:hypothetical protein